MMGGGSSAQDWVTIWQSEMAARAVDREAHEFVAQYASNWSQRAGDGAGEHATAGDDATAGLTGADAAAWPPSLGAAPDALRDGLEQLAHGFEALGRTTSGA